jgi:hypothetical protein
MAFGISATAAGSGAVPNLLVGAHAAASSAAAAAAAKGARRGKSSSAGSKSMQLAQAAAQAAATAAIAAVQQAEASQLCSALPPFGDITSVAHLWQLWKHGGNGKPAWEAQEAHGKGWRRGVKSGRQRWHELLRVISEVDRLAQEKRIKPEAAAAIMEAERDQDNSMAEYIKRELPAKLKARKALQEAAAPAADAQATAASQAAAAAAAAATAADAAAHRAAAAVASRLH